MLEFGGLKMIGCKVSVNMDGRRYVDAVLYEMDLGDIPIFIFQSSLRDRVWNFDWSLMQYIRTNRPFYNDLERKLKWT